MMEDKLLDMVIKTKDFTNMLDTYFKENYKSDGFLVFNEYNDKNIDCQFIYKVLVNDHEFIVTTDIAREDIENALLDIFDKSNYEMKSFSFIVEDHSYNGKEMSCITGVRILAKEKSVQKELKMQ